MTANTAIKQYQDYDYQVEQRGSSLLNYLMSRYAVEPSPWLATAVAHNLESLAAQTSCMNQGTYAGLVTLWQSIAEDQNVRGHDVLDEGWRAGLPFLRMCISDS